jgi:hypothetical protein
MAATPSTATRGATADRGIARRASARLSTETKHSSKTSELYIYLAVTIGVLIAGLVTKAGDGHDDRLNAHDTWLVVAIVTVGYLLSRGLAKSGSREPYFAGGTNDSRGEGEPYR